MSDETRHRCPSCGRENSPFNVACADCGAPLSAETQTRSSLQSEDTLPAAPRDGTGLAPGTRLGNLVVEQELGRGGMGVAYAAYDEQLERHVAIKVLVGPQAERTRARLLNEARAMARFNHPNIAVIHDVGVTDGRTYVVMERVEGVTLAEWSKAPRAPDEVLGVYLQAARGLAAAHAAGILHRDFKPANAMLGKDGRVRVLDFGLAGTDPSSPARGVSLPSLGGAAFGTPAYMSPEQRARGPVDARSDQFSFCVALWEALHGERPLALEGSEVVVRPVARRPGIPARIDRALRRGLAVEPAARHPGMEPLIRALADPWRARRGALIAAGALGLIGLAAGSAWALARPVACQGLDRRAAEVWPAGRRESLRGVLGAAASPVEQALDAYAAKWVEYRTDVCAATAVRHEQSEAALDLRTACTERLLAQLETVVDLLERPGANPARALDVVRVLDAPRVCDDVRALAAGHPPEDDPARREQVEALDRRLFAGYAVARAGRLVESATALGLVLLEAERFPALRARVLEKLGNVEIDTDLAAADTHLVAGAAAAMSTGQDHIAGKAFRSLILLRLTQRRYDDAHAMARLAEAAFERSSSENARDRADVHKFESDLYVREGKLTEGLASLEKARSLDDFTRELSLSAYDMREANILDKLGRDAEAREKYQTALAYIVRVKGEDHPQVATILNNLGSIAMDAGDLESALDFFRRSLAVKERVLGPTSLGSGITRGNVADALYRLRRYDEAEREVRAAIELIEKQLKADGEQLSYPLETLGGLLLDTGRAAEAVAPLERARAIREKLGQAEERASDEALLAKARAGR